MTNQNSERLPDHPIDSKALSSDLNMVAYQDPKKLLLTEAEAAIALGISRRTLWTLRTEGRIPFLRIGKCVRYSVEALKAWIEEKNKRRRPNLPR